MGSKCSASYREWWRAVSPTCDAVGGDDLLCMRSAGHGELHEHTRMSQDDSVMTVTRWPAMLNAAEQPDGTIAWVVGGRWCVVRPEPHEEVDLVSMMGIWRARVFLTALNHFADRAGLTIIDRVNRPWM